jgi:hypothetical protein
MNSQLVQDIRELRSNHQLLIDRRDAADALISNSSRKIAALESALSPEEKLELDPPPAEPAPEPAASDTQ